MAGSSLKRGYVDNNNFNSISWIWAHQVAEVHLELFGLRGCGGKLAEHERYLSGSKYYSFCVKSTFTHFL